MSSIKFIGFRGVGLLSKAIRFVTRSPFYSHIGYIDHNGKLIECWPTPGNKMQAWGYSKLDHHHDGTPYEIWELQVDPVQAKYIDWFFYRLAVHRIKYDWTGAIGFVFKLVRERNDRFFCSEGCVAPLVQYLGWHTITPAHISPGNFINIIQAAGAKIIEKGEAKHGTAA